MEHIFKSIEKHYKSKLPFVVYRKPNESEVKVFLQNDDTLNFTENFTESGFVFAPFDGLEQSIILPKEKCEVLQALYSDSEEFQNLVQINSSIRDKEKHIQLINRALEKINKNDIKKVVLSRHETVKLSNNNPILIFKKLLKNYNSAFVYCWFHPKIGLWLGATPETLMKIDDRQFSIMALAGTQEFNGSLNVEWGEKEQLEQKIVTDFIIEELTAMTDCLNVSDVETIKAGNLLHLKTIISARLKSTTTLKQLIKAIHPTPAVCGYSKLNAKAFILKNEGYDREFYTGFLGEINLESQVSPRMGVRNIENRAYSVLKKRTQLYVNLRCMQIKDAFAKVYVGGGITASSNPESEWNETLAKSVVIKKVL